MAGPWFTVQNSGDWQRLDTIWVSDGSSNVSAHLEMKARLTVAPESSQQQLPAHASPP
ncbi:MAG: hypothetical protein RIK87_12075 [Fuerstiella sp.]